MLNKQMNYIFKNLRYPQKLFSRTLENQRLLCNNGLSADIYLALSAVLNTLLKEQ